MSEILQRKRRGTVFVQGNLEKKEKSIVMQGFDRQFCRILYCPGCLEIFHDRNMPVNMEQCSHLMCQHCIKDQLVQQLKQNPDHGQSISVTCRKCNRNKRFQTLELFLKVSLINFEILSQVYRIRPKIAERGQKLYEEPDEGFEMYILGVKKVVKSPEMQEQIQMEQLMIQQMNQAIQQQQRQNEFVDQLRQEVVCVICRNEFNNSNHRPIMLEQCPHKICEDCCNQFKDAQGMIVCSVCQVSRRVKVMEGSMQKWLLIQSKKKKHVLRNDMDMINPQMLVISKAISGKQGQAGEDWEESKSSVSKAHKKLGTGVVQAKRLYGEDDMFDELKKKMQYMRVNNIRLQLNEPGQREIQCKFCTQVYNVLNRPLIVEYCPCGSIHQLCEECFLSQCIIELKAPSNKSNYIQNCPQSYVNEQPLESGDLSSKQQLLEYYLYPDNGGDSALFKDPQHSHCFLKVNTPLLHFIYSNHSHYAFDAEQEVILKNQEDYENDEEEFNILDMEQMSIGYDPFSFEDQIKQEKLSVINKRRTVLQINSENPFLDVEDIKPVLDNARKARDDQGAKSHIFGPPKLGSMVLVGIDEYKRCVGCNSKFDTGEQFPYLLKCNHNVCNECLRKVYSQSHEQTVSYVCHFEGEKSEFVKPSFYYEGAQVKETFANFLKLSVTLNTGMLQLVHNEKNKRDQMQKYIEKRMAMVKDMKQRLAAREMRHEEDNEYDDEDMADIEESKDFKQTVRSNHVSPGTVGGTDILYDIECPICLLCYSQENPPINLYCQQHPNHPFILCKNEIMYYVLKAGSDQNTIVSCPICHNDIEFATKGLSEQQVMGMFEVNQQLLGHIYGNKNILEYVQKEEEQFHIH